MPIYRLTDEIAFPPPEGASEEGIVAIGGDLSPERLVFAYECGIFPWPHRGLPLLWFSPQQRYVIEPQRAHLPKSLRRAIRRRAFEVTADTAFGKVVRGCAAPRPYERGTWITPAMRDGYGRLHRLGFAHSVEAWQGGDLAGGLYGVSLGRVFFGESMFALAPDASKVAFAALLGNLVAWDFAIVDCQMETEHLSRFGAVPWPRPVFLQALREALRAPTRPGPWRLELDPIAAMERVPG